MPQKSHVGTLDLDWDKLTVNCKVLSLSQMLLTNKQETKQGAIPCTWNTQHSTMSSLETEYLQFRILIYN